MREKLLQKGALKACSEVIDLDKTKRELDDYFSKKLEESGFEVCFFVFCFFVFCFCFFVCF